MISLAQQNGLFSGLAEHVTDGGIYILQYPDDTILLIKDEFEGARNLKLLLYVFETMSGLKINFDKIEVLLVQDDAVKQQEYAAMFNCQMGKWTITYLGAPVCARRIFVAEMNFLEEKFKKKMGGMDGWIYVNWWESH